MTPPCPLSAVSLFAGIGGFELGLAAAGIPTVASVEIDAAARGVLADRLPATVLLDDIRDVRGSDLRDAGFDPARGILTGGFPCQDLSVAGARAGLTGSRSGLFFEIIRLAEDLRPRWIFLENVPGLLSSHGGRDMGAVLGALGDIGYRWAYRVLDAQFCGVPQRRRRVVIVGCAGNTWASPDQVLLERPRRGGNPAPRRAPRKESAGGVAYGLGGGSRQDIAGTLGTFTGGFRTTDIDVVGAYVTAGYAFAENVHTPTGVRRMTPLEYERLQGFPDGWTATSNGEPQADTPRYRQLGNAVAVPVVAWVARRLAVTDAQTDSFTDPGEISA